MVEQQRLSDILNLGNSAAQIECLGENNFENLRSESVRELRLMAEYITFCTLMLCDVLLKMRLAFIAFANRFAWRTLLDYCPKIDDDTSQVVPVSKSLPALLVGS